MFANLSDLHCDEKDGGDLCFPKAWESCWRRIEFSDWLKNIEGVEKMIT